MEVSEQEDTIYYTIESEIVNWRLKEIQYAIKTLKKNKSPGNNKIVTEFLKLIGQNLIQKLHNLIQQK